MGVDLLGCLGFYEGLQPDGSHFFSVQFMTFHLQKPTHLGGFLQLLVDDMTGVLPFFGNKNCNGDEGPVLIKHAIIAEFSTFFA